MVRTHLSAVCECECLIAKSEVFFPNFPTVSPHSLRSILLLDRAIDDPQFRKQKQRKKKCELSRWAIFHRIADGENHYRIFTRLPRVAILHINNLRSSVENCWRSFLQLQPHDTVDASQHSGWRFFLFFAAFCPGTTPTLLSVKRQKLRFIGIGTNAAHVLSAHPILHSATLSVSKF